MNEEGWVTGKSDTIEYTIQKGYINMGELNSVYHPSQRNMKMMIV